VKVLQSKKNPVYGKVYPILYFVHCMYAMDRPVNMNKAKASLQCADSCKYGHGCYQVHSEINHIVYCDCEDQSVDKSEQELRLNLYVT
jgi:hypothetical protein